MFRAWLLVPWLCLMALCLASSAFWPSEGSNVPTVAELRAVTARSLEKTRLKAELIAATCDSSAGLYPDPTQTTVAGVASCAMHLDPTSGVVHDTEQEMLYGLALIVFLLAVHVVSSWARR